MHLPREVWQASGGWQEGSSRAGWINGRRWDLGWLVGSALVVPAILVAVWAGASADLVNLGVTALIGGPHLFSTYTATYLDPSFRRGHKLVLASAALVVPALVVYGAIVNYQVLISVFIFMASLHVLQQNAYLADVYRQRVGRAEPRWSRWSDVGLLMVSIYPIAAYKLVNGQFSLGETLVLIPRFLLVPATWMAVSAAFAALLGLWLYKTAREWRRGELNGPKTLLIAVTTVVAFLIPMAERGGRLELAFQGVNAWHSIQYLGIVWLIQSVRTRQGMVRSPVIRWMAAPGRGQLRFWGACLAVTAAVLGGVTALAHADPFGLRFKQYYAMMVLSPLLIHYVLDGYLFAVALRPGPGIDVMPYAVPARS